MRKRFAACGVFAGLFAMASMLVYTFFGAAIWLQFGEQSDERGALLVLVHVILLLWGIYGYGFFADRERGLRRF